MFVNFDSKWFQSYCNAVLESDPRIARAYIDDTRVNIEKRLHAPGVPDLERDAMQAALRYLNLINEIELRKAS